MKTRTVEWLRREKEKESVKHRLFYWKHYLLPMLLLGGMFAMVFWLQDNIRSSSEKYCSVLCETKAGEVNDVFEDIAMAVELLQTNLEQQVIDIEQIKDEKRREELSRTMETQMKESMELLPDIEQMYLRYSVELAGTKAELLYARVEDGKIIERDPLDLASYASADMQHVGWYYAVIRNGKAMWLDPYEDVGMQKEIISFVSPVYIGDTFLGLIGVDITIERLEELVSNMKIGEHGYALIYDKSGNSLWKAKKESEEEDSYYNVRSELANGMSMYVSAPKDEIDYLRDKNVFFFAEIILALGMFATILFGELHILYIHRRRDPQYTTNYKLINRCLSIVLITCVFVQLALNIVYMQEHKEGEPDLIEAENSYNTTLRVVADRQFSPYSYSLNGENLGYDVSLINEIGNRMKKNIQLSLLEWSACKKALENGEADIALGYETLMVKPKEKVLLSVYTAEDAYVVYGKEKISDVYDLLDAKVGTVNDSELKDAYGIYQNALAYANYEEELQALERGEITYAILRQNVGDLLLRKENYRDIKQVYHLMDSRLGMAVNEQDVALLAELNDAINKVKEDGTMDLLQKKWIWSKTLRWNPKNVLEEYPLYFAITILLECVAVSLLLMLTILKHNEDKEHYKVLMEVDKVTGLSTLNAGKTMVETFLIKESKGLFGTFMINSFDAIVENFGQEVAEEVQESVAVCLKKTFRDGDILMHVEENQFAFYAPKIEHKKIAEKIVNRLVHQIKTKGIEGLGKETVTINLVAIIRDQVHARSFDELLNHATLLAMEENTGDENIVRIESD